MRLEGASYEEIARAGGGILSTVRATRAADEAALLAAALPRVDALIAEGVTTLEIKSGYGLDRDTELRMLRVARAHRPGAAGAGAHDLPRRPRPAAGGHDRRRLPRRRLHPDAARRRTPRGWSTRSTASARASPSRRRRSRGSSPRRATLGLPVKLHAEQLSDLGGAALAARFGALSADHLE